MNNMAEVYRSSIGLQTDPLRTMKPSACCQCPATQISLRHAVVGCFPLLANLLYATKFAAAAIHCVIAACCLLFAYNTLAQSSEGNAGRIHGYKDDVPLSTGQIRRGNVCVNIIPVLQADGFFNGLERLDTAQGSEFRKNSRIVTNFPDFMAVEINIRIEDCDADVYTPVKTPDFIKGMHFRAQWKRGLDLRPADNVSIETKPVMMQEGDNRMLYVMKIRDHNVPLTDHLIVSVIGADGRLLSRMSARL
jgi:hypothetical protein